MSIVDLALSSHDLVVTHDSQETMDAVRAALVAYTKAKRAGLSDEECARATAAALEWKNDVTGSAKRSRMLG